MAVVITLFEALSLLDESLPLSSTSTKEQQSIAFLKNTAARNPDLHKALKRQAALAIKGVRRREKPKNKVSELEQMFGKYKEMDPNQSPDTYGVRAFITALARNRREAGKAKRFYDRAIDAYFRNLYGDSAFLPVAQELQNPEQELKESLFETRWLVEEIAVSFDIDKFKSLLSFAARVRYANQELQKIASGSARVVFAVDDNKVIKIAKNPKGLAQNRVEADIGQSSYDEVVARVLDYDSDHYTWVESERAKKVTPTKFEQLGGVDLASFGETLRAWYDENSGIKSIDDGYLPEDRVAIRKNLESNELIGNVTQLSADYDLPVSDMTRISSWGVVSRGGKETLVLVDYGLTQNVWNSHYNPKKR